MPLTVLEILLVAGLIVAALALRELWAGATEGRRGRLVRVDEGREPGAILRSARWRITGRPDEIRALPDGRWIPIEWKSRSAPPEGPRSSHRIQLLAYCLLCEETTGHPPPYGILRYGDGIEFRVPWTASARAELWRARNDLAEPYDGRHRASRGRCASCRWNRVCDVRVV